MRRGRIKNSTRYRDPEGGEKWIVRPRTSKTDRQKIQKRNRNLKEERE